MARDRAPFDGDFEKIADPTAISVEQEVLFRLATDPLADISLDVDLQTTLEHARFKEGAKFVSFLGQYGFDEVWLNDVDAAIHDSG